MSLNEDMRVWYNPDQTMKYSTWHIGQMSIIEFVWQLHEEDMMALGRS